MIVRLYHRHHGVHAPVKEAKIPGNINRYVKSSVVSKRVGEFFEIDEDRLVKALPKRFLPEPANKVLLTVEDRSRTGSTAQSGLKVFRNWSKYYDSYCIQLCRGKK